MRVKSAKVFGVAILGVSLFVSGLFTTEAALPLRELENLDRGVVAVVREGNQVFVSWRLLGTEPSNLAFDIYRRSGTRPPIKLNRHPLKGGTNYTDYGVNLAEDNVYLVKPEGPGLRKSRGGEFKLAAHTPANPYFTIPLKPVTATAGEYFVQHGWPGDLDGNGEYDYVVTRVPVEYAVNRKFIDAYRADGKFLWRIDLGKYSYTQIDANDAPPASVSEYYLGGWHDSDNVTVYDLDSDGRAEVLIRTFAGVTFADGSVIPETDLKTQYISVVDGQTGKEKNRLALENDYIDDGPLSGHFGIAYLDGVHPSLITSLKNRNSKKVFHWIISAFDYSRNKLTLRWKKVNQDGAEFHQIRILDLNADGKDEIHFGGWALGSNGQTLYTLAKVVHGDRFQVGDLDPARPGLEEYGIQQAENGHTDEFPWFYADATTGQIIRVGSPPADIGRGTAADIDPRYPGYELWCSAGGVYNVQGQEISAATPSVNYKIWWDGDLLGELLDVNYIDKWDYFNGSNNRLFTAEGVRVNSRNAPVFYGDLLGDWREEIVFETSDYSALRIYTTTIPTDIRLYTLPHNPAYRNTLAVKGYLQSTLVDYYLGNGLKTPTPPHIKLVEPRR